jgi:hypothetical protein
VRPGAPALGAAGYLVLAGAPGLTGYLAFPLIVAVGSSLEPIAAGYINRRIGSERRATVLSIQSMFRSLVMAGLAPGMGFTTDHWGLPQSFLVGAAVALASGLVFGIPFLRFARGSNPSNLGPALELPELLPGA